jgi:hypothetical protein
MFNSPILDIAIVLVFTYFILALIVSSINEGIMTITRQRSAFLKKAMQNLLFDDNWDKVYKELMKTPFIRSLQKEKSIFPTYIPSRNFAQAIISIIRDGKHEKYTLEHLRDQLNRPESMIQGDTRVLLLTLIDEAEGNMEKFRKSLEQFFDGSMERLSGWYKRMVGKILLVLACLLVVVLNIDTIQIVKQLWNDPKNAQKAVEYAIQASSQFKLDSAKVVVQGAEDTSDLYNISLNPQNDSIISEGTAMRKIDTTIKTTQALVVTLKEQPLPIGWINKNNYPHSGWWGWLMKCIGWTLTIAAVTLGAPFWFDLLNRIVNVRGTGKKPTVSEMIKE